MTDPQKQKNDNRQVEWSFDFSKVNESIQNLLGGLAGDEEVQTSEFSLQKSGVKSLTLNAGFSVGQSNVSALPTESPLLFNAMIKHVGNVTFEAEGTADKMVTLRQKMNPVKQAASSLRQSIRAVKDHEELTWDIQLAAGIPMTLDLNGGVGPSKIDLTSLIVTSLNVNTGVGTLSLVLPQQNEELAIHVNGGVGETKVFIPDNADGEIKVSGGVGTVEIVVPPQAAVQINATGGIGAVHVPKTLKRLTKPEFMEVGGVWQSDGYELAERRIHIRYTGGVGTLTVHEAELI